MAATPPLQFASTGPVPTPPSTLQQNLITLVTAEAPGFTADLPASLIEDMTDTAVYALATIDQARVDAVNNVSPYAANPYVLQQEGLQFGVPQGLAANGNALETFMGTPGYVIPLGFICSDGTYQYVVQGGGTVATNGYSQLLQVIATNSAVFPIPANSITTTVTSVPSPYTLTCTNVEAGVPAQSNESIESYRSRILEAFNVSISGTAAYLKTLLWALPGVETRLVSVLQQGTQWEVICGGGDPYQIAGAIYQGVSSLGLLSGSQVSPTRNVTVSIYDAPDTYSVVYVNPPQQVTVVAVTWNTTLANFTAGSAVNQYIIGAVQSYVNGIVVGQPINLLVLTEAIQTAIASVLAPQNLTTLNVTVTVNGVVRPPTLGTSIIPSDPESSFFVSPSGVTSTQG